MRRLVLVAVGAACSSTGHSRHAALLPDAPADAYVVIECNCSVLFQVGCDPGQKCVWAYGTTTQVPPGSIACAPDGTVPAGGACTYGPVVPSTYPQGCVSGSYDDCVRGTACWNGRCEPICDAQGGSPGCGSGQTCVTHDGLFEYGNAFVAGVCE